MESVDTHYKFRLTGTVNLSWLFSELESKKNDKVISDYSIRQSSIEQIFNRLVEVGVEEALR